MYFLKKYHYRPEEAANALKTVIKQCVQLVDNEQQNYSVKSARLYEKSWVLNTFDYKS
jgi:type I restriction-modification system